MSKIYYLMGKSSTGKDTIYKELRKRMPQLKNVTIYTTRPRREGEKEGEEYFFTDETELEKFKTEGRLIEERAYNTVYGIWNYFTADDGQFNFEQKNQDYLMIGTLESYEKLKTYFGNEKVVPLYIEVEDGERLTRALAREKTQKEPKYAAVSSPIPKISPKKTSPTPESQNVTKTQTLKTSLKKSVKRYLNSRDFNTQARQAPPVHMNFSLRNS